MAASSAITTITIIIIIKIKFQKSNPIIKTIRVRVVTIKLILNQFQ